VIDTYQSIKRGSRGAKRGYKPVLSDSASVSTADQYDEMETRPRKNPRLSESVPSSDTDEDIPARPRLRLRATKGGDSGNVLVSSGDSIEVVKGLRELHPNENSTISPREQREASVPSSRTLDAEPSSSARSGLRGICRPKGSYNEASYYKSMGVPRMPRKST
jgi:hypothetical protein